MKKSNLHKIIVLPILFILVSVLMAGCSSASATDSASSGLSTASQLALGILKLESTSNAMTASQAQQLLTLWEGYQAISNSDTVSQVELEALVKQIQGTLTTDQVKAIDAMNLTDQALSATLSTLGGNATTSQAAGTPSASAQSQAGSSSTSSSASNGIPSGGPSGAPPSGSGGMPPSGDSSGLSDILNSTSTQGTAVATQSPATTNTAQVNPMLLRAVIQLLETRSQPAG